jgi:hypothetical protein
VQTTLKNGGKFHAEKALESIVPAKRQVTDFFYPRTADESGVPLVSGRKPEKKKRVSYKAILVEEGDDETSHYDHIDECKEHEILRFVRYAIPVDEEAPSPLVARGGDGSWKMIYDCELTLSGSPTADQVDRKELFNLARFLSISEKALLWNKSLGDEEDGAYSYV